MRMRTLELPTIIVGPAVKTPFVVILDRFAPDEEWEDSMGDSLKESTGADGVIAFREHEIELYNDVTEDDRDRSYELSIATAQALVDQQQLSEYARKQAETRPNVARPF